MAKKTNDPEIERFLGEFERKVFPEIKDSAITLGILTKEADAKMCLEIGASVLLEKPLLMVVSKGMYVPMKLRQLADEMVEVNWPMNERDQELV